MNTITRFNVLTWNVLLDKGRTSAGLIKPQHERVNSMVAAFESFEGTCDVVGLQEVQRDGDHHTGEKIATRLGFNPGFWYEHNLPLYKGAARGRHGEHVGFFGELVDHSEPIDIGDQRLAVKTMVGEVALVTYHLRSGPKDISKRTEQMDIILEAVADEPMAILLGDTNAHPLEPSRRHLHAAGFESAHTLTGQKLPRTYPTREYAAVMAGDSSIKRLLYSNGGVSIDDISVRGLTVVAAGCFNSRPNAATGIPPSGPSDHIGLWATVESSKATETV